MRAEKILKYLADKKYEELELEAIREMALEKTGKPNFYKARLAYSKIAKKTHGLSRPTAAGAYEIHGKQMISDGYTAAVYNDIYDGLVRAEKCDETNRPDLSRVFEKNRPANGLYDIDSRIMAAAFKIAKAQKKKDSYFRFNGIFFKAQYVMQVLETLEDPRFSLTTPFRHEGNQVASLVIQSETGTGLVMCYNPKPDNKQNAIDNCIYACGDEL